MSKELSGAKLEKGFQKFIEKFEESDIGISAFDARLEQLTDAANEDGGSFSDIIEPGIEHLNKEWRYHDEIATVTGRLYIASPEVVEELTVIFGDIESDENNDSFFFVENAELVSNGLVDGPHGYGLDGAAARIAYAFSHPDINSDFAQLLLYPGEAYRHQYKLPTPEAVDMLLHHQWPAQMRQVDKLISFSDDPRNIPKRLALLARRLQTELRRSSDFREWMSVYVNERVKLAQVWPYYLELEGSLYFQDSEADSSWLEISYDKVLPLYARKPRFEFVLSSYFDQDVDDVRAMLFMEIPDDYDEWAGTEISVDTRNILNIRGTSPVRSLIDKALHGSEQSVDAVMAFAEDGQTTSPLTDEPVVNLVIPERPHHYGDPAPIEEMKLLQRELDSIIHDYKEAFDKTYDTQEQAIEVASALTNMIANRLVGAGISNYQLEFDGQYALRIKGANEKTSDQVEPGEFYLKYDVEDLFKELQHGDAFRAKFYGFVNDTKEEKGELTDEKRYKPLTRMIVDIETSTTNHLTYNLAPLVEINVMQRGLVSLDGSVKISVPSLDRYNRDKETRIELKKILGGRHQLVTDINKLYAGFLRETLDGFQEFKNIDVFLSVVKNLKKLDQPGHRQIMNAFEALLLKRKIVVDGLVIDAEGNTVEVQRFGGVVEDIRMDHLQVQDPGPYLVIADAEGVQGYVVAESISALLF